MKTKILFLIHDLGHGGAEKVLVNLVNNMDPEKFDITLTAMLEGGVNEQFLLPHVRYRTVFKKSFPGNSHVMKLLSPRALHRLCVKESYDIEVSYLEGPAARCVSGCENQETKLVSWIHCTMDAEKTFSGSFRSTAEAVSCYGKFHRNIFVSGGSRDAFCRFCPVEKAEVLYNTNESEKILRLSGEEVEPGLFRDDEIKLVGVGKLVANKGFDRLIRAHKQLRAAGHPVHTYILGEGDGRAALESLIAAEGVGDSVTLLGYNTNPYKYVAKCDLFVCSSFAEGFSTAATEALIVGTPVCTVEVSGMREMLGENCEFGLITENTEPALLDGLRRLVSSPELLAHYKKQAALRGKDFSTEATVKAVEDMLASL